LIEERPLLLKVADRQLVGLLHRPDGKPHRRGVVVVVGGPQYRVGSHRQFVALGRRLAHQGVVVLRFDYSGIGDSDGAAGTFESIEDDVRAAIDRLLTEVPAVKEVVLWGLCDGASAALMYAHQDPRVSGLVLLNPWVRTEAGLAQSYFRNYYGRRLMSADFWAKMLRTPRAIGVAAWEFARNLSATRNGADLTSAGVQRSFLDRMLMGAQRFRGDMLVLLSGNDLVATEFKLLLERADDWSAAFSRPQITTSALPDANHTFSSQHWRSWVEEQTFRFVRGDPLHR